ncbi:MAG: glycerol-3-phosphate 1-O-acyltransferase PlsY [candidate division WOR-3 bacterium]
MNAVGSLLFGLLFGSIPFGYLFGRLRRTDVRTRGSGNIGFTNVYRVFGLGWAIPVLLLDVGKGMVPVALAPTIRFVPGLVGAGAVLGHVFCPWLGLRGGKGVATTIGVSALLCPRSLLAGLVLYAVVLLASGFVSASSLVFAVALPVLTAFLYQHNPSLLAFTIVVALVMLVRHIGNIRRLLRGTEPKFGLWLKLFKKQK